MEVNIKQMRKSKQEIITQYKTLLAKAEEVRKTRILLEAALDRDDIMAEIRKIENKIHEECKNLLILAKALDEIIDIYTENEREIYNNYEERRKIRRFEIHIIPMIRPYIIKLLRIE